MGDSNPAVSARAERKSISERLKWFHGRRLFWIVLVVAGLFYARFPFWKQPALGDRANWDYFAQVISRGGVPYRDVVNIKGPLAAYIGAASILIAQPFGLRDVFAIRIAFLFLAALTVAVTFLLTLEYSDNLRLAALAATAMLMFDPFARFNGAGVQPKTPMILFGLLSLWAMLKDRPFAAGLLAMLSALSWQPGLLFAGVTGLAASRYLTSWRDRRAFKVIAGAALPLAIVLLYFWAAGALREFYLWNIDFTAGVYGPRYTRTPANFFDHFGKLLNGAYQPARWLFYTAIIGAGVALWQWRQATRQGRSRLDDAPRHAVLISGLVYFIFCMIDIQGAVDLIPLLPFVAIFAAVVLDYALDALGHVSVRAGLEGKRAIIERCAAVILITAMLYQSMLRMNPVENVLPSLGDQDAIVAEILAQLQPGDKVFTHGVPELLVLGRLTNASKYFLLDRGKDVYLDVVEPGGFAGWLDRLKAERPRIISLGRFAEVEHEKDFRAWAAADYVARPNPVLTYYVRKEDGR